jgi:hypothetical protein
MKPVTRQHCLLLSFNHESMLIVRFSDSTHRMMALASGYNRPLPANARLNISPQPPPASKFMNLASGYNRPLPPAELTKPASKFSTLFLVASSKLQSTVCNAVARATARIDCCLNCACSTRTTG